MVNYYCESPISHPSSRKKSVEKTLFRQVQQKKVALDIIRQIREAILGGKLRAGDRLPTEKELVTKFGVSKHTLREAVRALEAMGFLTVRKGAGGGPVVLEVDMKTTRDSIANFLHFQNISVRDLSEVRKLFEPYLTRLACERLSREGVEKLEARNLACREALAHGESMRENEIDFHRILAAASGNPVLLMMVDFVNSLLSDSKAHLRPGLAFSEEVLAAHERILAAIKKGDAELAGTEMCRHVCDVEAALEVLRAEKTGGMKGEGSVSGEPTEPKEAAVTEPFTL